MSFDLVTHLAAAQIIVRHSPHWEKFIDGTPLSNDIAVWMSEFAWAAVEESTERIKYLEAAHRIGAENVAGTRRELAELREAHGGAVIAQHAAVERAELAEGMFSEMQKFESIRNGDLVEALEQFINSCTPNPTEHPSLFAAWNRARMAVKGMPNEQGEPRGQAVGENAEGKVSNRAPATPAPPPPSNPAGRGGKRKVHALMYLDRPSGEIEVHIVGTYYPARLGTKAHPMDRFAEPDEEAEVADIAAETKAGEIGLTDAELETAAAKLMEVVNEE